MDPISRAEHEEFCRRMEEHLHRQDKRLEQLDVDVRKTQDIAVAVERLAISMENMVEEQKRQGSRLGVLESRDGEMWRKVAGYIVTAVVGIVVGFIFRQFGF